ncbi:MAG: hypothetical protein NTX24_02610 [Candidatus Pacearchaeota archaeon]|nr:hypothetical protein [Candidatus Pacearchaeota archaeon]
MPEKVDGYIDEAKIDHIFGKPKPVFQSLGCGIHNGHFYFGTVIYAENKPFDAVITDTGDYHIAYPMRDEIKEVFGLNYRFPLYDDMIDYAWSNEGISDFLKGVYNPEEMKIILKNQFEKIKKKIEELMEYHDKRIYLSVACDIISTYFLPVWSARGITYFKGDAGSGKTKSASIYGLSAFNPLQAGNITPSALFRTIESTKGTMIIDNFDNLPEDQKNEIIHLLQVCYKKGLKYSRSEEKGKQRRPTTFDTFCNLVLNNIMGLDDVTLSRCNETDLLKTTSDKGKLQPDSKDAFWKIFRDDMHVYALQNWKAVLECYEELDVDLINRDLEKVKPILTIAKIVDEQVYKQLLDYFKEQSELSKVKDLKDDWGYQLLKKIKEIVSQNGDCCIKTETLTDELANLVLDSEARDYKKQKHGLSIFIGKRIRAVPMWKNSGRMINGKSEYFFKREDIQKLLEIKGYVENSTNPTIPTNSTNPTNSTSEILVEKVELVELKGDKQENETPNTN